MEYIKSNLQVDSIADRDDGGDDSEALPPGISVSKFDYSVENHFKVMDNIAKLSGESASECDRTEIQRLSSSITFLREWRHLCYQPQAIRFACQSGTPQRKDVIEGINLPQFSSAAIPKEDISDGNKISSHLSKDFVMYVGGLVWALDWCPRVQQSPDCDINVEFITVAAHPPESSYHKIGAPLTGRGVIQIWCVLNAGVKDQHVIRSVKEKPRKYTRNGEATKVKASQPKRPRGRPRKNPKNESVDNLDGSDRHMQPLAVQFPEDSIKLLNTDAKEETDRNAKSSAARKPRGRPKKKPLKESVDNLDGNKKHLQSHAKCLDYSPKTDKSSQATPEFLSKEDSCRDQNAPGEVKTVQQNSRGAESINFNSNKPHKTKGSLRKKRKTDSVDSFDRSNQYLQPLAVEFPEDSSNLLAVDGSSLETTVIVAREDNCNTQNNSRAGVSIELQEQNPGGSDAINLGSCIPWKLRGRPNRNPLEESVVDLDDRNICPEPFPVEIIKDPFRTDKTFLETPVKISEEATSRNQNALGEGVSTKVQLNSGGTETMNFTPSKLEKLKGMPRKGRVKQSINNLDGSDQYLLPEFPERSSKLLAVDKISFETPEIVAKEDHCRSHIGLWAGVPPEHLQQNPKGSDAKHLKLSEPWKPRNKPIHNAVDNSNCCNQHVQALAVQLTKDSSKILPEDGILSKTHEQVTKRDSSQKQKGSDKWSSGKSVWTASESRLTKCQTRINSQLNGTYLPMLSPNCGTSLTETSSSCGQDPMRSSENIANPVLVGTDTINCSISVDVALPKLVMCLAHNGKVAWDVKWRPSDSHANSKHRMGYLAVLLGNGALEVWEVPLPCVTKAIFSCSQKVGIDPRFIKLEPVFRCSVLKFGDRRSIPLTLEWSTSSPHDLILAGCHDGAVALWKFSANGLSKDTRPLLCFSADNVPIRALAWEPVVSDPESANLIVTAGHKGIKFWDVRDPFRPLWEIHSVQRIIYSLDWLPAPRCIVLSFDDGEIRIISLLKAACDVPVTGMPFVGTQQQGLHSYHCSSSSIWSVQVSRPTGMVAYCCSDGTVLRFQLTSKAVEKDPHRNREPHYLCGSLTEEESTLTVWSPLPDIPFPIKKSSNEWGDTPRSRRGFLAISNQEKRAKEHIAKCQTPPEEPPPPLALCYGNDPGIESGSDDTLVAQKSKPIAKTKSSSKKKPKPMDEVSENVKADDEEFPPKMVAMHRVRWNMNKGSERWLCYGGAAGIVRCQEINL